MHIFFCTCRRISFLVVHHKRIWFNRGFETNTYLHNQAAKNVDTYATQWLQAVDMEHTQHNDYKRFTWNIHNPMTTSGSHVTYTTQWLQSVHMEHTQHIYYKRFTWNTHNTMTTSGSHGTHTTQWLQAVHMEHTEHNDYKRLTWNIYNTMTTSGSHGTHNTMTASCSHGTHTTHTHTYITQWLQAVHMEQHKDKCKTNENRYALIRGSHILGKPIMDMWQSSVHRQCAVPTSGVLFSQLVCFPVFSTRSAILTLANVGYSHIHLPTPANPLCSLSIHRRLQLKASVQFLFLRLYIRLRCGSDVIHPSFYPNTSRISFVTS
jgi:hypothetical protein